MDFETRVQKLNCLSYSFIDSTRPANLGRHYEYTYTHITCRAISYGLLSDHNSANCFTDLAWLDGSRISCPGVHRCGQVKTVEWSSRWKIFHRSRNYGSLKIVDLSERENLKKMRPKRDLHDQSRRIIDQNLWKHMKLNGGWRSVADCQMKRSSEVWGSVTDRKEIIFYNKIIRKI